jgi:hypothetical protein
MMEEVFYFYQAGNEYTHDLFTSLAFVSALFVVTFLEFNAENAKKTRSAQRKASECVDHFLHIVR